VRPKRRFRHEAFFYAGDDEFVTGVSSFVRDGLSRGEPTLVLVTGGNLQLLRTELGDQPGLWFADVAVVGHNPARIIPAWHDFVDEHLGGGVRLRGVGEPVRPGLDPDVLVECEHHEALLNLAFPPLLDMWMLCPYDTVALERRALDTARRTHPCVVQNGSRQDSATYEEVAALASPPGDPLPVPPSGSVEVRFDAGCLSTLRALVADRARQVGLSADREADLVLSVNEIAANSIQYAGGSGTLNIWRDGGSVVCEIRDKGTITDPLVGRLAPGTSPESSRGLWVVNQLCDLVQVRSSADGTVVRMHMSLTRGRRSPRGGDPQPR
jgi:anti-sigma regulatory factor (Ser/Thr protein kinase)